jgi:molybdate transport system substrate-binding protein
MRRACAALALTALLAGCGGDEGGGDKPRLVVSAAASMTEALRACARDYEEATVKLSFGGSDELAAQIRQGVKPDVYAAANTALPEQLAEDGLLGRPVEFATNELVLAVPSGSDVGSLEDVADSGVKLAIGSESVPVGTYTREVLSKLPRAEREAILANVRSNEPDVKGVVGKLTQRAADAGFVYRSDVEATNGELRAVELPDPLRPTVVYAAGVVDGAKEPDAAEEYVGGLVNGPCGDALRGAGFGAPPSG